MSVERVHQKHDKGYKHLLQSKKAFIDLLKSFVRADWVEQVQEKDLVRIDKSFILQDFSGKEADIVYRSRIEGQDIIFYVLLEMQSTVDYQMPWRLYLYMAEVWRDILKNTKIEEAESRDYRIPSIVPMVLYNGKSPWTAVRSFREYQRGSHLFGKELADFRYILINVESYSEEELLELTSVMSMVFYLDQKVDKEELLRRLGTLTGCFAKLNKSEQKLLLTWISNVLKTQLPEKSVKEVLMNSEGVFALEYNIQRLLEKEKKQAIEQGLEQGIEEGIEKGIAQGIEKGIEKGIELGRRQGKLESAKKMLMLGIDIDKISEATGLTEEEVLKLDKQ